MKPKVIERGSYGILDFYVNYGAASSIHDDWIWKILHQKGFKGNNAVFGYWTSMSMENRETWEFAHKYRGKIWYICGAQLIPLIGSIFPTEIAWKKNFDKNGKRRQILIYRVDFSMCLAQQGPFFKK